GFSRYFSSPNQKIPRNPVSRPVNLRVDIFHEMHARDSPKLRSKSSYRQDTKSFKIKVGAMITPIIPKT
ncbi:hypothetical protein QUB10_25200, partial [Microcoleus sp. B5-D4]